MSSALTPVVAPSAALSVAVPGSSTPAASNDGLTNGSVLVYACAEFGTVDPTGYTAGSGTAWNPSSTVLPTCRSATFGQTRVVPAGLLDHGRLTRPGRRG